MAMSVLNLSSVPLQNKWTAKALTSITIAKQKTNEKTN